MSDNIIDLVEITKSKLNNFGELLDSIESLSDKKKQLWKEIYANAITDRQNSYAMFQILAKISGDKTNEHAIHARSMATYIERMSKANDQLIKLADLIAAAEKENESVDPEEMFDQISNGRQVGSGNRK